MCVHVCWRERSCMSVLMYANMNLYALMYICMHNCVYMYVYVSVCIPYRIMLLYLGMIMWSV